MVVGKTGGAAWVRGITLIRTKGCVVFLLCQALAQLPECYLIVLNTSFFPFTRFLGLLQRALVSETQGSSLFFAMILILP